MRRVEIHNEKEVIRLLIVGDLAAFRQVYNRFNNELLTFCQKITKAKEPAEEIIQDVFTILWQKREALDPELPICPYLYTITKNLAFNFLKKVTLECRLKQEVFHSNLKEYTLDEEVELIDAQQLVDQAINKLPTRQKEIYILSRNSFKSHAEISGDLSISKNTVKDQLFKALRSIRAYLKENEVELFQ